MSTTALIAYKIYSSSRTAVSSVSKGAFNRIAIIIVESAAVYSLFLLVYAIMLVDPPFGKIGTSAYNGEYYVGPLMTVVAVSTDFANPDVKLCVLLIIHPGIGPDSLGGEDCSCTCSWRPDNCTNGYTHIWFTVPSPE